MRLPLIGLSCLALAVATASASVGKTAGRLSCTSGTAVVQTRTARVFRINDGEGYFRYYGCLKPHGRVRFLGHRYDFPDHAGFWRPRLSGARVSFVSTYRGRGDASSEVDVVNLQTGRRHVRFHGCDIPGMCDPPTDAIEATDLAFRADGALAWIWRVANYDTSDPEDTIYEVYARGRRGVAVRLDRATDIAPRSLGVSSRRVRWTRSGVPQSASLTDRAD